MLACVAAPLVALGLARLAPAPVTPLRAPLWSKGPAAPRCPYARQHTESIADERALVEYMARCARVLWVRTGSHVGKRTDLDVVAENLAVLRFPVVLVTSDGDRAVPSSYDERTVRALLDSPRVVRWMTQNYDGTVEHRKLRAMPIGFDLHTAPRALLVPARRAQRRAVLCDALTPSHPERAGMRAALEGNALVTFLDRRVPADELMELYASFEFVLSPRGNGLDCHRTWEVVLAGSIAITRSSSLDAMYAGFPVVVVREWHEVTAENLGRWARAARRAVLPRLEFGYWLEPALVIGGTARDCAVYLPGAFARLDALAATRKVFYVFYESNSDDETLALLRAFVARRDGVVLTERTEGARTERIARGRNAVVREVERLVGFDFFVNLDLDDRCAFDVRSVEECLRRADEWDVATANQTREYYDRWALRTAAMGDLYAGAPHCIVGYEPRGQSELSECAPLPPISAWFPRQGLEGKRTFPPDGPYYAVDSAFGGLAIYKTELLRGARYAWSRDGAPECEHVPFHAAIKRGSPAARIVIAPYLISGA
jgi:hypothetical protein